MELWFVSAAFLARERVLCAYAVERLFLWLDLEFGSRDGGDLVEEALEEGCGRVIGRPPAKRGIEASDGGPLNK